MWWEKKKIHVSSLRVSHPLSLTSDSRPKELIKTWFCFNAWNPLPSTAVVPCNPKVEATKFGSYFERYNGFLGCCCWVSSTKLYMHSSPFAITFPPFIVFLSKSLPYFLTRWYLYLLLVWFVRKKNGDWSTKKQRERGWILIFLTWKMLYLYDMLTKQQLIPTFTCIWHKHN